MDVYVSRCGLSVGQVGNLSNTSIGPEGPQIATLHGGCCISRTRSFQSVPKDRRLQRKGCPEKAAFSLFQSVPMDRRLQRISLLTFVARQSFNRSRRTADCNWNLLGHCKWHEVGFQSVPKDRRLQPTAWRSRSTTSVSIGPEGPQIATNSYSQNVSQLLCFNRSRRTADCNSRSTLLFSLIGRSFNRSRRTADCNQDQTLNTVRPYRFNRSRRTADCNNNSAAVIWVHNRVSIGPEGPQIATLNSTCKSLQQNVVSIGPEGPQIATLMAI